MGKVSYWRWSVVGLAVLAFVVLNGVALGADEVNGKAAYQTNGCAACHGASGEGGAGPALKGAAFTQKFSSADKLTDLIRKGNGGMPAYAEARIDKGQMDDLVAFILSLSSSPASATKAEAAKPAAAEAAKSEPSKAVAKAVSAASTEASETSDGALTFEQWYGLVVVVLAVMLLLLFALVLNGPLKLRNQKQGR